jgi:hypothetical protein
VDLPKQISALYTENEWEEEWDKNRKNMNKLGGPLKRNLKP